jgi:hypothetical protein
MKRRMILFALIFLVAWGYGSSHVYAQDTSFQTKFIGKWKEQTAGVKEGSILNITAVEPATGQLQGKWIPPTGPAAGKEFEVIGWVSSAKPIPDVENVIVVCFSVSLTTYGSLTSYTGFLKDNKIITLSHNIRPNSRYEWDHITANAAVFTKAP